MAKYDGLMQRLQRVEAYASEDTSINIDLKGDYSFVVNGDIERFYKPYPCVRSFHMSPSRQKLIMGPFASGKTTGCIAEIILHACKMPKWHKGIRKVKWAIIRNTAAQLETTTVETWLNWFGDLDYDKPRRNKKPVLRYQHRFRDNEGWVEIEAIFLALDNEDDIKKLKSLDITCAYINELSEVPHALFEVIDGRVGRFPVRNDYWRGVIADTNPPKLNSWIHHNFVTTPLDGHALFKQPPALLPNPDRDGYKWITNPDAENGAKMGDYWLEQSKGKTEEYVKVYCLGEFGTLSYGKAVYPEYNDDIHSAPTLDIIPGSPLYLSFDFGLTPACVIIQQSHTGQIRVVREVITEEIMGLQQFITSMVMPALTAYFPGLDVYHVTGDPAGNIRVDTDQNNCFNMLNGYWPRRCEPCITNKIPQRLEAVRFLLTQLISGKPMFIISREGAPILRIGFLGEYVFRELHVVGEKRYHEEPHKNFYSHIQDACQYSAVHFSNLMKRPAPHVDTTKIIRKGLRF